MSFSINNVAFHFRLLNSFAPYMSHTKLKPDKISALSSIVFFGYPDYKKLIETFSEVFLSQDTIDNSSVESKRL